MRSSCSSREVSVDLPQLSPERSRNLPRLALTQSDPPDMRRFEPELPSNACEDPGCPDNSQEVLVGRGIFIGHISAGQDMAQNQPKFINLGLQSQGEKVSLPGWSVQIRKLMDGQRLERKAFGTKLNVTQQSVSNWLTGKKEPKPEMYYRMASIWPTADEVPFLLKRAADISGSFQVPGFEPMIGKRKPTAGTRRVKFGKLSSEAVEIPLLKDPAATGTPRQVNEEEIEDFLPLPGSLCPHPEEIVCIKVQGDSMSPLLEEGYIVAVDTAQTDRARLHGQMVAARDPEGGVTIKWLRVVGKQEILIPQHTSKRHQPIILSRNDEEESGWAIVGRVLWWIGMPS
jgi:SOS-response transcriptional repressor LexA